MFERGNFSYLLFFILDIGLTLLALSLAKVLRETLPLGILLDEPLEFSVFLYLIVAVIWVIVFTALKIYSPARSLRYAQDIPAVWGATLGATLIFAGAAYLLFRELSRLLFLYFFILDILFLSVWRWLLPDFPALARQMYGADKRRVLVVGAGPLGQKLAQAIIKHSKINLTFVGFVDDSAAPSAEMPLMEGALGHSLDEQPALPILGQIDDIPKLVEQYELQEVIFALPQTEQAVIRRAVMTLQAVPVNLRLVPDVFDLVFLQASVEEFEGIPLIGLREPAIQGVDRLLKRLFDLALSFVLLILFAPLIGLIAILIKLDSPGPIFFLQKRVGEGGNLFWMVKFRSMIDGAETQETGLLQQSNAGLPVFLKNRDDARVTRIGHLLRRTSLDELPQLINVLKGDMSLVGPRPELPGMVEKYAHWQRKRFAVPQGMTGWWQVNGRMDRADPQQRAEDDLFYLQNYSFWLDLRILWKTIQAVILGKGAY